ncbi:hypothetical protein KP77_12090 [Jeotgalibacillus alimentarius]|uniref:Uncharacterized protein n=1 Tax=Jeotgalibacillus alimentarius TaxID=135826 RepID=A0A0C2VRZ2_9BACL|nr:hypothetical protein [Jeotgalibacillus alimentarius]KIL51697.1 hypothetical protein KP77_12090 [Jeotgalibacillus alimentarius]
MEDLIAPVLIIALILILIKTNVLQLKTVAKAYKQTGRSLTVNYKLLRGTEIYGFFLKKNEMYTVHYDVEMKEGSLELIFRGKKKEEFFREVFEQSESGSFEFETAKRIHTLEVCGQKAKGKCKVKLDKHER